jgi:hypothetical protein
MVATPVATPVTTPVDELIVAMLVLLEDHVPPDTVDVKELVAPIQMAWLPLRVPADGRAVMVITRVAVAFAQPPVPVTV